MIGIMEPSDSRRIGATSAALGTDFSQIVACVLLCQIAGFPLGRIEGSSAGVVRKSGDIY